MPSLLPLFQWANNLGVAEWVRKSTWIFPAAETVHIVALAVLFGAIVFVDLQMLGLVRRDTSASNLERELRPWTFSSLIVILSTGALLFSSEAMKLYINVPFQIKIVTLFVAIAFNYTIHRKVIGADPVRLGLVRVKLTAVVSIMLWLSVGFAGRAIGFF
jgi:hypothetical protein